MKNIFLNLLLAVGMILLPYIKVFAQKELQDNIQIRWRSSIDYNGKDNLGLQLILKNLSNTSINLQGWDLWFNSLYPVIERKANGYSFSDEKGNLFKLQFKDQVVHPYDSLVFDYETKFHIINISTVPNGFYLQDKSDINNYIALENVIYEPLDKSTLYNKDFYEVLFDKNARLNIVSSFCPIFPTPKFIEHSDSDFYEIGSKLEYFIEPSLKLSEFLISKFRDRFDVELIESVERESSLRVLQDNSLGKEVYKLRIDNSGIEIQASTEVGVFYAMQSLFSTFDYTTVDQHGKRKLLQYLTVYDEPRYEYRGFMMDIARNFKDKEVIKKYLDIMASYKLNVFHLHFIDDEGWRLEISTLPELTEVGARRSPSYPNGNALRPAYGSGANYTDKYYLSRADFIEILKYAKERQITVIPEIETPGHASAAIKSMKARYERLMAQGKIMEAEEYLLHDVQDKSVYNSVQNFDDNVLNPALPSVYTFVNKILDELKSMYLEAGLDLAIISLGGDEVPNGAWEKSPKILDLMKNKGFRSVNEVWPYYISRINELCKSKGMKLAGWEEIGMVNQGSGMVVNAGLENKENMLLDVWNNVIGSGQEDLAYKLANAGYPIVLISASNMYFDMMWNTSFLEPGLSWATYADLYHSYSLLPESFFANIDTYYSGKKIGKSGFKDKIRLSEKGKANFKGIKGGLFAETVHTESKLDYMVFPRFFALAERAWSPKRDYESEEEFDLNLFDRDYQKFINRLGTVDLPRLAQQFLFRLPSVGLKLIDDVIFANVEYPGFTIFYTSDGSMPTLGSTKYSPSVGVKRQNGANYVFAVIDDLGRLGAPSYFN